MYNIWFIFIPIVMFSLATVFNQKYKYFFLITYVIFSVMYAFRGEIGTDWQGYLYYYNNIFDPLVASTSGFEPGFLLLCKIFRGIGFSYWIMVFCISLFVTYLFYKATEYQTSNMGIAALIGLFFFFYPSLEALRQSIAIAMFYYSLKYIDDNPKLYFSINIIGVMFHRTAIMVLFFYFFRKYLWAKIISVVGIVLFQTLKPVLLKVLSHFPMYLEKFLWYTSENGSFVHLFSFKIIEIILLLGILLFLQRKYCKKFLSTSLLEMSIWIQALLPIVLDSAYRFGYYTDLGIILAYCDIYDCINKRSHRVVYICCLVAYILLRFTSLIRSNPALFGLGGYA